MVDTEYLYTRMNQAFLATHGYMIDLADYHEYVGISAKIMWADLKEKAHLPYPVDMLIEMEKKQKFNVLQEQDLYPIAGIPELLNGLKSAGAKIALASSSMRKNIDLILAKSRLAPYFDFVISGDDVTHGKPDPEIFQAVLKYYNADPADAIVVEDSANGARAAKAATIFTIGFQNPNSGNQNLHLADLIIQDFNKETNREIIDVYLS